MARVVFRPRVSRRVPSKTWFAELATAPGPQAIGVTGDNSFDTLFGREWLLEWSVEDDHLRLYQESATHPGEWERVTSPLPPVFDSPLPATARRVTFCFDQSARMIVAYEDEGIVKVTRWDTGTNQYVQNVSFAGVDPVVVMDATWARDIPNSDVLIFYLSNDRTQVRCRVQRQLYATEHEIHDYGNQNPVILDRVVVGFLAYEVLVSDANGAPLENVLLSDPYPYPASEALDVNAAPETLQAERAAYYSDPPPLELPSNAVPVTFAQTSDRAEVALGPEAAVGDSEPVPVIVYVGNRAEKTVTPDALEGAAEPNATAVHSQARVLYTHDDPEEVTGDAEPVPTFAYRQA